MAHLISSTSFFNARIVNTAQRRRLLFKDLAKEVCLKEKFEGGESDGNGREGKLHSKENL